MKQFFGIYLNITAPNYKTEMDKELFMFLHDFNKNLPEYKNSNNKYLKKISDLLSDYPQYYFEIVNHDFDSNDVEEQTFFFNASPYMNARVYIYDFKYELQIEVLKNIALYIESKFNVPLMLCYSDLVQVSPDEDDGDYDVMGDEFAEAFYVENETIRTIAENNTDSELHDEYLQKLDEGLDTPEFRECEKKFEAELAEKGKKHDEDFNNFLKDNNFTIGPDYTDEDYTIEMSSTSDGTEPEQVYYDDDDEDDDED